MESLEYIERQEQAAKQLQDQVIIQKIHTTILIPTLNEEVNITYVLNELTRHIDSTFEILIVDGGSTDKTLEISRQFPQVRNITVPKGKGRAIVEGAKNSKGKYVIVFDGDFSHRASEIERYTELLNKGADLVKGSRFLPGGDTLDMSPIRYLGNRVFLMLSNLLTRSRWTDLCYGLFAARRSLFEQLCVEEHSFAFDVRFLLRAALEGYLVLEVPSKERPRLNGLSRLSTTMDGYRILRAIVTESFRSRLRKVH